MLRWLASVVLLTAFLSGLVSASIGTAQYQNYQCKEAGQGGETKSKDDGPTNIVTTLAWMSCWHAEAWTALATIFLAFITVGLVILGFEQSKTSRAELRAYVKMSHTSPGFTFDAAGPVTQIEVRNNGRTPANVSYVLIKLEVFHPSETLPVEPNYDGGTIIPSSSAFLVANSKFFVPALSRMSSDDVIALHRQAGRRAVIYGYGQASGRVREAIYA